MVVEMSRHWASIRGTRVFFPGRPSGMELQFSGQTVSQTLLLHISYYPKYAPRATCYLSLVT